MKNLQNKFISGLDGLRALAVIMVVGYHLKLPIFKGGVLGVTIFFVISGFLITRLLLQELENNDSINLKTFWIKRIKRIWPALIFMISITIIVYAIFNRILFTKACRDFFSAIFGFNNWYQIFNNISYFDNGGAPSPLLHCWSLAIETQFYLIFPLIIILISKFRSNKKKRYQLLSVITFLLIIISSLLMAFLFQPTGDPSRVYYGLDTRAFSLLIGALLAIFTQCDFSFSLKKPINDVMGIISLLVVCFIVTHIAGYDEVLYKGGYLLTSFFTALVILSILRRNSLLSKVLSIPVIDWLGKLSYSIYLWHYPIIILISGGKKSSWYIMLLEVVLSLVMAVISYYVVETPIRREIISKTIKAMKTKTNQQILKKGISTIALCLTLIVSSCLCVAFVPRESVSAQNQKQVVKKVTKKEVKEETKKEETSTVSDEEILNNLDIFIIGDSVAEGASSKLQATFPKGKFDLRVSRHCSESVPVLQEQLDNGWDGDCLVFSLGTNGPMYDFMPKVRAMLKADKPMFVLSLRAPYEEWTDDNNTEIKKFCEENENVYLIDWASYSEGHGDWFVRDETHLTTAGTDGFANCMKEKILEVYKEKLTTKKLTK